MRINKYLALAGLGSRRGVEQLVKLGTVAVNGRVVTNLATEINENDEVFVNGEKVTTSNKTVVYLLNKPRGVVTTAKDEKGRKTVMDFVPTSPRVFPCGRLDYDTDGLLIMTNDGDFCEKLIHPRYEVRKEYVINSICKNIQKSIQQLKSGVRLSDGLFKPDLVEVLSSRGDKLTLKIVMHDGRNRIIRRACAAVRIEINKLTRTAIGPYKLGEIGVGKYKILN